MVDYNRLKSDIGESNAFILQNGTKIRNLVSLIESLLNMDDHFFSEHVTNDKNDFANWISHCFEDELLAERVRKLHTKQEIAEEIKIRLEQLKLSQSLKSPNENNSQSSNLELDADLDSNLDSSLDITPSQSVGIKPLELNSPIKKQETIQKVEEKLDSSLDTSLNSSLDSSLDDSLDASLDISKQEIKQEQIELIKQPILKPIEPAPLIKESIVTPKIEEVKVIESVKVEEVKTVKPIIIEEIKYVTLEESKPVEVLTPKIDIKPEVIIPKSAITKDSLSDEDKRILETDNKYLNPTQLFKKFKLQKIVAKEETKVEVKVEEKVETSTNPMVDDKPEYNLEGLTDAEKQLLETENSKLPFKELFKKLKIQKERLIKKDGIKKEKPSVIVAKTEQKIEIKPEIKTEPQKQKEAPPLDLLGISDDEFNKLIGVNPEEQFVALTSKEHIVQVKDKKKLKTGVPGFDELVDKGIPQGSAILVSGGPGSGKTTFCIQQLGWAADHGERCLFISLEEQEERLVDHMKGYGLNPDKYLKTGHLKVKKLDSFKLARSVEALLAHARGELMIDIEPVLDIIPDGFKPERVVLDSLSSIAAAFAGKPEEYRIYVEQLFNIFERVGATSFIITEIQGSESTGHGGVEDFLADGVINFYNMRKGNLRQPAMEVFKMRGTRHKKKIVPFNFVSGKGIEIYPLEEVFNEQ